MKALLALEDGFHLWGQSFTGPIELAGGEVIFHTAMTGYQELITDPSCYGQMVCLTWPLVGNCGINQEDNESAGIHLNALLLKECCREPSNFRAVESLPDFLKRHGKPGLEGLDTRALALHIRQNGALRGAISTTVLEAEALAAQARAMPKAEGLNLVPEVAAKTLYRWDPKLPNNGGPIQVKLEENGSYHWPSEGQKAYRAKIIVYDYGVRWNILRLLTAYDLDLLVVPPTFSPAQVEAVRPDGIFLSNGPGDPAALTEETAIVKNLSASWPMAGTGLGHQILALALGGQTARLKFGRHGVNHPVKNLSTGKIEISAQNHGFQVLSVNLQATHVNLNDQSLAGFRHPDKPLCAIQHHPETATSPVDSRPFLAYFRDLVLENKAR